MDSVTLDAEPASEAVYAPPDAIQQLAPVQSHSTRIKRRPGQRGKDLTGSEVADILRWSAQGLNQYEIADKFEGRRTQSTISDVLARFGPDRTPQAKAILRGGSADMALNIVKRGKPKDQVQALKGLGVLEDQQPQGVTVIVGGGGQVNIGVMLSPRTVDGSGEGP